MNSCEILRCIYTNPAKKLPIGLRKCHNTSLTYSTESVSPPASFSGSPFPLYPLLNIICLPVPSIRIYNRKSLSPSSSRVRTGLLIPGWAPYKIIIVITIRWLSLVILRSAYPRHGCNGIQPLHQLQAVCDTQSQTETH